MQTLVQGSLEKKAEALAYLNQMLEQGHSSSELILSNSSLVLTQVCSAFEWVFENKQSLNQQFLQFFLNTIHKACVFPKFLAGASFDALHGFVDRIMKRLIAEDESAVKSENVLRLINSSMLRVLENAQQEHIYRVLTLMLIECRLAQN